MFHPYLLRVMAQEKDTCALVLVGCFGLFNLENRLDEFFVDAGICMLTWWMQKASKTLCDPAHHSDTCRTTEAFIIPSWRNAMPVKRRS